MTQYVALLRGIGPTNPNMRAQILRGVFEQLEFSYVGSVLGTGNILFASRETEEKKLETQIETAIKQELGFTSATIIRSRKEMEQLAAREPFRGLVDSPTCKCNVTFFKTPREGKREITWTIDTTTQETVKKMAALEKEYGKAITTRTWGTVKKILAKFGTLQGETL